MVALAFTQNIKVVNCSVCGSPIALTDNQPNRVRGIDIVCPVCDASPGAECTDVRTHRGRFHHERTGAAALTSRRIRGAAASVEGNRE